MKNILLLALFSLVLSSAYAANPNPGDEVKSEKNTGNLCACMINTWYDRKGNVETIADFAEYSGVGTTLDAHREKVMTDKLQTVFDNHTRIWDSYKSGFTASFEGSCDEMRAKMKAEGITYESSNTWPVY